LKSDSGILHIEILSHMVKSLKTSDDFHDNQLAVDMKAVYSSWSSVASQVQGETSNTFAPTTRLPLSPHQAKTS
jgi:hypothetical protein